MAKTLSSISLDLPAAPVSAQVNDTFTFAGTPGFTGTGGVNRYDFKWEVDPGTGFVTIDNSTTGLTTANTNPLTNSNSSTQNSITVTCSATGNYTLRISGAPTTGGSYTVTSSTQTVKVVLVSNAFAQAQTTITLATIVRVFAQAQVSMRPTYTTYTDLFNRTVASGLGGDWALISTQSTDSVDGVAANFIISSSGTNSYYVLDQNIVGDLRTAQGYEFYAKFKVTNLSTTTVDELILDVIPVVGTQNGSVGAIFRIKNTSADVLGGMGFSTSTPATISSPSANTYYSGRVHAIPVHGGTLFRSKIWLSSNSEPGWGAESQINSTFTGSLIRFWIFGPSVATTLSIDEFSVTSAFLTQYAQAQTKIAGLPSTTTYAQSQADILATSSKYAQAQADIKATSNKFAQAQGDIKVTSNVFAQAQVRLVVTSNQFSQAQADIKTTVNVFAQSTADIKNTLTKYAQSQADIKQTYPLVAPGTTGWDFNLTAGTHVDGGDASNSAVLGSFTHLGGSLTITISNWSLINVFNDFNSVASSITTSFTTLTYPTPTWTGTVAAGTYSVTINVSGTNCLNPVDGAEADTTGHVDVTFSSIINPTFSQSQADIKSITNQFAQSQVDIKAVGNKFAQASTDIKATSNRFAQSQADIQQTYLVFAQAQVQIKSILILNAPAQAQADILATTKTYAQAQADILAISQEFGQANVDIRVTNNSFAQAQVLIYIAQNLKPIADITTNSWVGVVV